MFFLPSYMKQTTNTSWARTNTPQICVGGFVIIIYCCYAWPHFTPTVNGKDISCSIRLEKNLSMFARSGVGESVANIYDTQDSSK